MQFTLNFIEFYYSLTLQIFYIGELEAAHKCIVTINV